MRKFLQFTFSLLAMLMVTINANAWKFTLLSPAEGEVTSLDEIKIQAPGSVAEWTAVPIPVKKDGAEFKKWNMADDWSFTNTIVGKAADYAAAEEPGVYTMEIPAGAYHIGADANEAQTFTWTIKGQGSSAEPWTFAAVDPAEGTVTSVKNFTFTMPSGTTLGAGGYVDMMCPDGQNHQVLIAGTSANPTGDTYIAAMEAPGTYTMTIAAGTLKDNANTPNAAMTYTWTIGSSSTGWKFASVTPAEGQVESLKTLTFVLPSGQNYLNTGGTGTITLPDGTTKDVSIYDNFSSINGDILVDNPLTAPGTYTLTIPAGAIEGSDGTKNDAMTYTWTIAGSTPPAKDYTVSYDKANTCLTIAWPAGTVLAATDAAGSINIQIIGYGATPYTMVNYNASNEIVTYTALADGDYTLAIEAGQFTINGTPNEAISETFTVGGTSGGGGSFSGEPSHETIFKAGETTVVKPIVFDTEGVTITAVDGEFELGGSTTTIPFGYNTYSENELDWNNKCKFVVVAKKDINKVIFIPTASGKSAIAYVSANGGDGEYTNGVWEGKLAAGETLTLTSNDGTQIKEIYVCYNGDDFDPTAGGGDEKGVITIQYPVENQLIATQTNGAKFCTFTTNKEYAQVTIQIVNSNPVYDNLDAFPIRMVDNAGENSDNLHVGENTVTASTPDAKTWYFYKGDSYKMVVKGFVNMWDVMPDNYDAIAEVNFVGDGKEHEAESLIKLLNVTPATSMESIGTLAMVNGVITLEFDGPVTSVKAVTPEGMGGNGINHSTAAKAGSDNKVWEINLGDQSSFATSETEGNPIIEVDVTATAADGIVLFSDTRADRGLELKYELVAGAGPTPSAVTLGSPVWSVAENAEIEASTTSINIKFPNATNVEGTYTIELSGTIGDKNLNLVPVNGSGTMADGVDLTVALSENVGYNLTVGTITIKNGETVVYSTSNGNYQLNFGTKAGQGGGTGANILGEATFTADETGITVAWPNAQISNISGCAVSFGEWTLTHKGVNYSFYPELMYPEGNNVSVNIPYTKIAVWDDTIGEWGAYVPVEVAPGDEITVSMIAGEGVYVWEDYDDWGPCVYTNAYPITGTVTVPGNEPQPTSVVLYEKGVDPEVAASSEGDPKRDLVIEKTDVKLTISNTNASSTYAYITNAYIDNTKGGIVTAGNSNVLKFTSTRTIEKIEFTATSTIAQKANTSCVGTLADNVWTGEASEISIAIGSGSAPKISKIVVYFKDTTTGIQNVAPVVIENGKMFNLAGQQVKASAKGIVIMNGKKYVVK